MVFKFFFFNSHPFCSDIKSWNPLRWPIDCSKWSTTLTQEQVPSLSLGCPKTFLFHFGYIKADIYHIFCILNMIYIKTKNEVSKCLDFLFNFPDGLLRHKTVTCWTSNIFYGDTIHSSTMMANFSMTHTLYVFPFINLNIHYTKYNFMNHFFLTPE